MGGITVMRNCPPESILLAVGTDAVSDRTFGLLEAHVEGCRDCQEALEAARRAASSETAKEPCDEAPELPDLIIESRLGQGGASVVYLAREPELGRHVAVKVFPRNSLVDPHVREHWLSEARALSRVSHEHVVKVHRVGETTDWLWLVLEYIAGGTLKRRLKGPLSPRDAARLVETIARAVGYLHAQGVCHLDLKPSNILLVGAQDASWGEVSPRISDFGIARLEGEPGTTATGANGPKGTPSYMAPEQVVALPGTIGPAADIYALGAVFFELLTGRPPFSGATTAETLDQVRHQDPVPPRQLNRRIPRDLETVCLKCLEKSPDRRYPTAEALAADLGLWLAGRPIRARRVSPINRGWRWCRRHRAVAGLLFAWLLTLAAGTVVLFLLLGMAEADRVHLAEANRRAMAQEKVAETTVSELRAILQAIFLLKRGGSPSDLARVVANLQNQIEYVRVQGVVPPLTIGAMEMEVGLLLSEHFSRVGDPRELLRLAVLDIRKGLDADRGNKEARDFLCKALLNYGLFEEEAGHFETTLSSFEETFHCMKAEDSTLRVVEAFTNLFPRLQTLDDRFVTDGRAGLHARAQVLSRQMIRRLLETEATPPGAEALDPGPEAVASRLYRKAIATRTQHDDGRPRRNSFDQFASDWLALSVRHLTPFRPSYTAAGDPKSPQERALAIVADLKARCARVELPESMVPWAIRSMLRVAKNAGGEQRRMKRLDDARASASCLMALAQEAIREFPDNACGSFVLSDAHDQVRKNAIRSNDASLEEQSLQAAIEAAQKAVTLAPDQPEIQHHLALLNERLANKRTGQALIAVPPAAPSPAPHP